MCFAADILDISYCYKVFFMARLPGPVKQGDREQDLLLSQHCAGDLLLLHGMRVLIFFIQVLDIMKLWFVTIRGWEEKESKVGGDTDKDGVAMKQFLFMLLVA